MRRHQSVAFVKHLTPTRLISDGVQIVDPMLIVVDRLDPTNVLRNRGEVASVVLTDDALQSVDDGSG